MHVDAISIKDVHALQIAMMQPVSRELVWVGDCIRADGASRFFLDGNGTILAVCELIRARLSPASQLFYPTDVGYEDTIKHFLESSSMRSFCSVEPGATADVAMIVCIVVTCNVSL